MKQRRRRGEGEAKPAIMHGVWLGTGEGKDRIVVLRPMGAILGELSGEGVMREEFGQGSAMSGVH